MKRRAGAPVAASLGFAIGVLGADGSPQHGRAAMANPGQQGGAVSTGQVTSPDFDVAEQSITALLNGMRQGRVTSRQLVERYLARIEAYDRAGPRLNAIVTLNPRALDLADALDRERREGRVRGPLHGIPIIVADNLATADMPTSGGLRALAGFTTSADATVVRRLRDRGAVILGKANVDDLGAGRAGVSSQGGEMRNPYDPSRNPGGAGGGVAAAVAASFAAGGIAADTDGGLRMAAAQTGLVGIRTTMGLVSRHGLLPLAPSQDVVGPLARTTTDLLFLLDAMVGPDADDPATEAGDGRFPPTYAGVVGDSGLGDIQIGVVTSMFGSGTEAAEVSALVTHALDAIGHMGASVTDVTIPGLDAFLNGTSMVDVELEPHVRTFLSAFPAAPVHSVEEIVVDGRVHPLVEPVLRQSLSLGTRRVQVREDTLARRDEARRVVLEAMRLRNLTALAYPAVRRPPSAAGVPQVGANGQLSATTGLPAMTMPVGLTTNGLPVGLELLGGTFGEGPLLKVAYAYERAIAPRTPPSLTR